MVPQREVAKNYKLFLENATEQLNKRVTYILTEKGNYGIWDEQCETNQSHSFRCFPQPFWKLPLIDLGR